MDDNAMNKNRLNVSGDDSYLLGRAFNGSWWRKAYVRQDMYPNIIYTSHNTFQVILIW